jgi:D-alanyl-D-alanine dipeptidase
VDDVTGELRRFERATVAEPWRPVGERGRIVVGKNGTAWDPATHRLSLARPRQKAMAARPPGCRPWARFRVCPAPEASWLKLPYLPLVEGIECVDDASSAFYNQIVDRRQVRAPDWASSEKMREIGEPYRWGVVIDYNTRAVAQRGSCVFLHIGGDGGRGTAGCTAMPEHDLQTVMGWLDPMAAPVLVQLPRAAYDRLRSEWSLP